MIRIPFVTSRPDFFVERMVADDARAVARLHTEDFSRPWSVDEFEQLIGQSTVFGFVVRQVGAGRAPAGFVLARLAAGEAEILTVAVARAHRRAGLGRELMDAVLRELHAERAEALFLEVDETNAPALGLYRKLGFREVGRRPGYYTRKDAPATGALVMRRDLR